MNKHEQYEKNAATQIIWYKLIILAQPKVNTTRLQHLFSELIQQKLAKPLNRHSTRIQLVLHNNEDVEDQNRAEKKKKGKKVASHHKCTDGNSHHHWHEWVSDFPNRQCSMSQGRSLCVIHYLGLQLLRQTFTQITSITQD